MKSSPREFKSTFKVLWPWLNWLLRRSNWWVVRVPMFKSLGWADCGAQTDAHHQGTHQGQEHQVPWITEKGHLTFWAQFLEKSHLPGAGVMMRKRSLEDKRQAPGWESGGDWSLGGLRSIRWAGRWKSLQTELIFTMCAGKANGGKRHLKNTHLK